MADENPDEISDDIEKLEERKLFYEEWMNRYRGAQRAAPFVQMNLDMTNWELDALKNRPSEASEIPYKGISDQLDRENQYFRGVLPLIPNYGIPALYSSTAFSASGTVSVYEYVSRVGDLGTSDALNYANKYTANYHEIQNAHNRPNQIRELIIRLSAAGSLDRFDRAHQAYMTYKSQTGSRSAAAMEMRTLLDGIKGDLFERARKWPKENMTWEYMSSRLAVRSERKAAEQELRKQGYVHSSLINRLSEVGKDREGGSLTNIDHIWTELLDHLYSVLGLVKVDEETPNY